MTLRSLPRRFTAALASVADDPAHEGVVRRVGPDGASALDHLTHVTRTIALLDRALDQVLVHEGPVLHPAVADPSARAWDTPPEITVDESLAELADGAGAMAHRIEHTAADDWARTGQVAGGGGCTALDLVRDAVGVAINRLRAAETTLRAVRVQPDPDHRP